MTPGSRWACTCADYRFHGQNLYDQRIQNKVTLAAEVQLGELRVDPDSSLVTWNVTKNDGFEYVVVIGTEGDTGTLCKHVLAALWSLGLTPVLVEYEDGDREVRTETFWTDPIALEAIMDDGDVLKVTPLERSNDGV